MRALIVALETLEHSGTVRLLLAAVLLFTLAGCDVSPAQFRANRVYARNQKLGKTLEDFETPEVRQRMDDIERAVARFFGTPDAPRVPALEDIDVADLLDLDKLQMAAGPGGDHGHGRVRGLYRDYCARCHGISGEGTGPLAALLNPYPRDFRLGLFKFKATANTTPPTGEDLDRVLDRGIPGTAMPSFNLLGAEQREALVQYVRYLSMRGMFERKVIAEVAIEFDEGDRLLDEKLREIDPTAYGEQLDDLRVLLEEVVLPWTTAADHVIDAPPRPDDYGSPASTARGRELFFTTLTNCAKCHGATAVGDGQTEDYDDWDKELEPTNLQALSDYLALGALPPRKAQPRNLRQGIYRGGSRPEDLFVRIRNGIAGTTMPVIASQVTDDDVWHLVDYVRHLPFEPINHFPPPASEPAVGAAASGDPPAGPAEKRP